LDRKKATPLDFIDYTVTDFHGEDGKCRGTVTDLILDAHLIPPCGLIPPYKVVASVFRSGGSRSGMSPGCICEPFELSEADYWQAVQKLAQFTPEELKSRHRDPHIAGEIEPDYAAPDTDDYQVWLKSLVQRGHLPGGPFNEVSR
jgi:hypothetical protein